MPTIKAGNISKGMYLLYKNEPHMVTKADFFHPGKGSSVNRLKLKSVKTGNSQDATFKTQEDIEYIDVSSVEMQFLYRDGEDLVFMDSRTYEQASVPARMIEPFQTELLSPEVSAYVIFTDDKPIALSLPPKVRLKVIESPDAVAGNTVGQAKKTVTVVTGYQLQAPVFIRVGDTLVIDSETGLYVKRESE